MPEQRLQRCRDAYETVPVLTERDRVDAVILAIHHGWRPWRVERRASAAYRITKAQQAADTKK